jgi:hypothetical protein
MVAAFGVAEALSEGENRSQPLWFTTTLPNGDELLSSAMLTASDIGRTSFGEESSAGSVIRCLGNSDSELSLPTTR